MWEITEKEGNIIFFDAKDNIIIYFDKQNEVPYLLNALLQIVNSECSQDDIFAINVKASCDIYLTKENARQILNILFPKYKQFCFDGLRQLQ